MCTFKKWCTINFPNPGRIYYWKGGTREAELWLLRPGQQLHGGCRVRLLPEGAPTGENAVFPGRVPLPGHDPAARVGAALSLRSGGENSEAGSPVSERCQELLLSSRQAKEVFFLFSRKKSIFIFCLLTGEGECRKV